MPLEGLKLFGSTVKNFSSSLGWGTNKSSVRVNLVQDSYLGDYFLPPPVGAPSYVTFGSLNFWGLLQKWEKSLSQEGFPIYDVLIEDPRDILDGTEVILGVYNNNTYGVPNLINVFGYWENLLGFGGSKINDSGMPWYLIRQGLLNIINSPIQTNFGGPLKYKGYSYNLDLSQLPTTSNSYRVGGGTNMSLMAIIQNVCDENALDFFVDMTPGTRNIRVRTVSRRLQPPVGYIQQLINENLATGLCVNSTVGLEARNETTSAFVVGGEVTTIYETSSNHTVHQYFGKDVNNNPIIGIGTDYSMTALLNSSEVKDIIGTNGYYCSALEMSCALADINTWLNYMYALKPTFSDMIGIISPNVNPAINILHGPVVPVFPADTLNLAPNFVAAASGMSVEDISNYIIQRMYNFVQKISQEFLGKKYLIEIPFMFTQTESETGRILHSYDVTNAGYIESGVAPLGLSSIFADNFKTSDNRYEPMAVQAALSGADLSRINTGDYLVDIYGGGKIYIKISIDEEIVFLDELTPCVVVTVNNPIYNVPIDATGAGIAEIAAIFQMNTVDCANLMNSLGAGNFFGKISPLPVSPTGWAIPLKSNILSYGPWYKIGAYGKVNFIHDSGLVPWNYGNSTVMDLAARAKVEEAVSYQQQAESGSIELVGAPIFNIGDQLQISSNALLGPSLTGMDIRYSDKGVTTTYRMQTFSANRLGTHYKGEVERYKKAALLNNKLNRDARQLWRKSLLPNPNLANIEISTLASSQLRGWPGQFQRNSPHAYLIGMVDSDAEFSDLRRTSVTTTSDNEFITSININSDYYNRTAAMSLTGIVRPFSTMYNHEEMACYELPNPSYTDAIDGTFLNPFKVNNDVEIYIHGNSYSDAHSYLNDGPDENVRGFALRGPLILSGWGWCTDDAFVPNSNPTDLSGGELTNYLRKSWYWKTGAVDLLWDDERKVWTPHGFMCGKTIGAIPSGSSGLVKLWSITGEITGRKKDRTVYNFFSRTVPALTKIQACWNPDITAWVIISADCP